MSVKDTTFWRKHQYTLDNGANSMLRNGNMFHITTPKNGYIIRGTVKQFMRDSLQYIYIQQLNHCDACIITTSCVNTHMHFNCTMRLVSYDTVIAEVIFNRENRGNSEKPYMTITIGEHWNYSRTTIQHVYKFLRYFGITDLCVSDIAKNDKRIGCGRYTYATYLFKNNVGNTYAIRFTDDCVYDFMLNNASHFINRQMGRL